MPAEQRDQNGDTTPEWLIHSFIIKVWQDLATRGLGGGGWRGHITHVPGAERRYLKSLDEIADFIAPYLSGIGVRLNWRWQLRRWLRGSKRKQ